MDDTYLRRKDSGLFLYRRKTPQLLREKYGKAQIQYSLGTSNRQEAILKRNAINAEIELELAHIKRGNSDKALFLSITLSGAKSIKSANQKSLTSSLITRWKMLSLSCL